MMRFLGRLSTCALGAALLFAITGAPQAQIPDEFTNLTVFPEDIRKRELVSIMRGFVGALGVRCDHCHVAKTPGSLKGMDFASDELEPKKVARAMMKMTTEINSKLLPATGRRSLMRVRCVTCHRGLTEPRSLDQILLETVKTQDVAAAAKRYRELRDEYYGTGAYDFSAGTLNHVAETLAADDAVGAIELLKLNLSFHSESAYSYMMLGQLQAMNGDKEAAATSVERSLELEPDNPRAKRMLERLRSSE
jgi:hypothetical protein